ncbi:MAG: hypothetical protein CFE43_03040 [Burkholderiales bacterium PBB3]|nr:MAG: hypothetical protein CFE43_03040 [Burkholderiales bacterium PBB3]
MGLLTKILPEPVIRWLNDALRDTSTDRFSRVFHASPDWIVISRLSDNVIVEANQGFEVLSGYRARDVIGKPISNFDIWVDPRQRADIVERLKRDGIVRHVHTKARRRDGTVRDFDVNVTLISVDGALNSHSVWLCRDITESRLAAESLQESESRFAMLFALSPIPMCYANGEDQFATTLWNDAWFANFGFDPAAAQSKSGGELNVWVYPEDRQKIIGMAASGLTESHMETLMRRADGSLRQVSVSTRLFADGKYPLLVSTYVDVTEREESRQKIETLNAELESRVLARTAELRAINEELSQTLKTLQRAKDQLVQSEKLAALGSLVAGVAHELNTPIGNGLTVASSLEHRVEAFSGLLDVGMRRSDLQSFVDETRLAAEIITRNLSRAGQLVSSFKQVAVDQTSSHRRHFALASLIAENLLTLNAVTRKYACQIEVKVAAQIMMESYPGPLGQVLTNLINNALLHGFQPNDPGSIVIGAELVGDSWVALSVRDTGKGIDTDNLHRIFEPFFTTHLGQGGSGLGLHIVHNIVGGVLGGEIKVSSELGQGAEFSVLLPLVAPQRMQD